MSVRVRLTRVGNRKNPIWRVVVADQRSPRDGRIIETVGRYNPQHQPSEIVLDRERLDHWIGRGAQPSDTVKRLMRADARGAPVAAAAPAGEDGTPAGAGDDGTPAAAAEDGTPVAPEEASTEGAPADDLPAEEVPAEEGAADDAPEGAASAVAPEAEDNV